MSEIMKTENVNNELVLGNKDNSSSHYRIKWDRNPVQIGEIVKQCVDELKVRYLINQCLEERSVL